MLTGYSAGGYAALLYTPVLVGMYPRAHVAVVADASAGMLASDAFLHTAMRGWGADAFFEGARPL